MLFVTFAPSHSSAGRRIEASQDIRLSVEPYATDSDKIRETILSRLLSLRYVRFFFSVLFRKVDIVWCWGHDSAFVATLAAVFRPKLKIIWDISDINRHLLGKGLTSRALRAIEKLLLKRADRMFLTSPGFYDNYYSTRIARARVRIVENRRSRTLLEQVQPPVYGGPLVIVFAGIFRSPAVLRLVEEVATRMGDAVRFELYGYPGRNLPPDIVADAAALHPNIVDRGPFSLNDVHELHRHANLVWGYTDPAESDNERWLLSNRIYDSIITGRPILTNDDTVSGEYVRQHSIGLTTAFRADEVTRVLMALRADNFKTYRALIEAMPDPATGYMNNDYATAITELSDEAPA